MAEWVEREVLMAVKAYPNPDEGYGEACCTAGVTREGQWVRIWPVPFRDLRPEQQFKKWQWIRALLRKSSDPRPESHDVQPETITCLEEVSTRNDWAERLRIVEPHFLPSLEALEDQQRQGSRTMAYVRPAEIVSFEIEERPDPDWDERRKAILGQLRLFGREKATLERIPYKFYYRFRCADDRCKKPHRLQVLDWEIGESYRSWRVRYGDRWEEAIRQKYEHELVRECDLVFNLGNYIRYPASFGITALVYPRRSRS